MAQQTNEIASAVTQHIIPEFHDALTKANRIWNFLTKEGRYSVSGGTNIQFPIKLIANASSGFIAGSGATVSVNPSIQMQYGTLNWKYYYYTVNFSLEDFVQTQNSEEAVLDFIESKMDGALADAVREQTSALHGTSTNYEYNGLQDVVAASGTAYAGLTDTDYSPSDAYLPYIDTNTTVNYSVINKMIQTLKARMQQTPMAGKQVKELIGLWNENVQEAFLNSAQNQQRFYESKKLDTGFEGIAVNGVNFYMDAYTPGSKDGSTADNYTYVMPIAVLKMAAKYGLGGKGSPLDGQVQIPNQPIKSNQYYIAGNLICVDRRLISVNKTLVA